MTIEMEAQNLTQVRLALDCAVDIILLDNMPESILRRAIAVIRSRPSLELSGSRRPSPAPPSTPIPVGEHTMLPPKAEGNPHPTRGSGPLIEISGGVNLKTAGALARIGPDRISVGQLTHSSKALDISFDIK